MPHQILLLDTPRSGSHLLDRMIGHGTEIKHLDSPFSAARGKQIGWMLREGHEKGMTYQEGADFTTALSAGITKWREALSDAEDTVSPTTEDSTHSAQLTEQQGKTLFLKDHILNSSHGREILQIQYNYKSPSPHQDPTDPYPFLPAGANPTRIPDDLLLALGTVPILLIRHPLCTIPSAMRVLQRMGLPHGGGRTNFRAVTSQDHTRVMYDFYRAHYNPSQAVMPLIVDYDDIATSQPFVRHLCTLLGLDPTEAKFSWPALTAEGKREMHPSYYISQTRLKESSGVMPELATRNRDLEGERKGWVKGWWREFGREDVEMMEEMVGLAMPNYEWLWERRVRLPGGGEA
ncbi:hypothetical protein LTR78_005207 [Recurvomyces mirabilis]|uniref:P-loop containing nucleoside triphosphate hydrolase protein n=1 Tax=Recurvomyces mirabilis TaxID=574656 RepID=A0AAE1C1Y0_9PEZI|nr:hypothetical protein LTR78_005207 [Recurvomyces mirabilis]KAK5157757.1 hypothetical protein LTS14_003679 [Recurvomyces mirabilis]